MHCFVAKHGPNKGKPINKPWNIAFNKSSISDYLNRKCNGSHVHVPCSGQNTKGTKYYSPEIANAFRRFFKADFSRGFKACCASSLFSMPAAPLAPCIPALACLSLRRAIIGEAAGEGAMAGAGLPGADQPDFSDGPRLGRTGDGANPTLDTRTTMIEEMDVELQKKGSLYD
eukprot:10308375-Heterocapsa_arctica.AAC.1